MNQPLVSVIVPCYNVEQYLPKCIDSILYQTYKDLEVWLVDDGSFLSMTDPPMLPELSVMNMQRRMLVSKLSIRKMAGWQMLVMWLWM